MSDKIDRGAQNATKEPHALAGQLSPSSVDAAFSEGGEKALEEAREDVASGTPSEQAECPSQGTLLHSSGRLPLCHSCSKPFVPPARDRSACVEFNTTLRTFDIAPQPESLENVHQGVSGQHDKLMKKTRVRDLKLASVRKYVQRENEDPVSATVCQACLNKKLRHLPTLRFIAPPPLAESATTSSANALKVCTAPKDFSMRNNQRTPLQTGLLSSVGVDDKFDGLHTGVEGSDPHALLPTVNVVAEGMRDANISIPSHAEKNIEFNQSQAASSRVSVDVTYEQGPILTTSEFPNVPSEKLLLLRHNRSAVGPYDGKDLSFLAPITVLADGMEGTKNSSPSGISSEEEQAPVSANDLERSESEDTHDE